MLISRSRICGTRLCRLLVMARLKLFDVAAQGRFAPAPFPLIHLEKREQSLFRQVINPPLRQAGERCYCRYAVEQIIRQVFVSSFASEVKGTYYLV